MFKIRIYLFLLVSLVIAFISVGSVSAEMSPRDGYVKTPTGAPLAGVTIAEYSDWCPPAAQIEGMMGSECLNPASCHSERRVKTDANGYYYFPVGVQPFNPNDKCNMNVWWRYTCSNPEVFYKIILDSPESASGIITSAHAAAEENICPPPVQHPTSNTPAVITTPISCPPPAACNTVCQNSTQCAFAADGCTACVEGLCKKPAACNQSCDRDTECEKGENGCTSCAMNDAGTGKVCRPPAACNVSCANDAQCEKAGNGCTSCGMNDAGTGKVCRPAPACNVACANNAQCEKAGDGCTACVNGACKIPPACGTACTTRNDCSGAKEGCSECLEGTCTDYNDNMCKCDGMVADMSNINDSFKFEAFGKVEGADTKKAEIADITFRMTKDNVVVARSNPITPTVVENTANKLRFKADWQTAPPAVDKNATYRVFADVRCKPKKITASIQQQNTLASVNAEVSPESAKQGDGKFGPKGLKFIVDSLNSAFGSGKWFGHALVGEALAQLSSPSPSPSANQSNLQLQTLNFVKVMDTDNCRFVMFKYDETLF